MFKEDIEKSIKISFLLILFLTTVSYLVFAQENDDLIVGSISADGNPVEGLNIIVNMAMGENYIPIFNITTDSEGQFEVNEDLFGHSFLLEFQNGNVPHFHEFTSINETYVVDFNLSGSVVFEIIGLDGEVREGIHVNLINNLGYVVGHTETDSSGTGGFDGLNIWDYFMLNFNYEGVPYSEVFNFGNRTSANVEFRLLETTTSDDQIESYMHHVVVETGDEYLNIWEGITFRNLGSQVFNNSMLRIWIPPNAEDVVSDIMDCCVQTTDEGLLIDPMDPIFPSGTFETKVEYKIKPKSTKQILSTKMEYATGSFLYLIEKAPDIKIENPVGLTFDSERNLAGTDYLIYRSSALEAGKTVSIQLTGLITWTDVLLHNPFIWAGGLLLVPAAILVYFFGLRKGKSVGYNTLEMEIQDKSLDNSHLVDIDDQLLRDQNTEDLRAEKNALTSVLEKIKEDYGNGFISDEVYSSLISRYNENLNNINEKLVESLSEVEREELETEKLAMESMIEKFESDYKKGALSERAFLELKNRYEVRLAVIRKKLKFSE